MSKSIIVATALVLATCTPATSAPTAKPDVKAPELLATSSAAVELGPKAVITTLALREVELGGRHLYLNFEDITGTASTSYGVYLDVAPGTTDFEAQHVLFVGTLSMYGVREATRDGQKGVTYVHDVTSVVANLQSTKGWDPKTLSVTIVPIGDAAPTTKATIRTVRLFAADQPK